MKAGRNTKRKIPGRNVKCPGGYSAFVPDPLPPKFMWTPELVRSLSDADYLLGRLAGEGRRLPNPYLLIRPFIRREAVLSSRIEGTQTTLGELLATEAGLVVERSPDDLCEVGNYVAALEHGLARLESLPLSLRFVRELHEKLLLKVRGGHATPGEFRRSQNWIGPTGCTLSNATYVPQPMDEMMNCLGEWENFLHDHTLPPLIQLALAHYQFEAIHPFIDGNGRVGRLVVTLFLVERSILPTPLLYLSAFFEATRQEYYDRLLAVSNHGEWEAWLIYFLNAVARQSEDSLSRAERINGYFSKWQLALAGVGGKTPLLLLDLILANPYITAKRAVKELGVAFTTAQRAIDKLVDLSILYELSGAKRNRVYYARDILKILEEPAKLTPDHTPNV